MIPSNFRIEILSIRALLYAIGSKGLMLHKFGVDIKNARLYKQLHINFSVDTLN